jgi:hypothetical protein
MRKEEHIIFQNHLFLMFRVIHKSLPHCIIAKYKKSAYCRQIHLLPETFSFFNIFSKYKDT